MSEHVIAVENNTICELFGTDIADKDIITIDMEVRDILFNKLTDGLKFLSRKVAKAEDVTFENRNRQFATYTVLADNSGSETTYALYQRMKGSGDARLGGKYSIGWGGHPNMMDAASNVTGGIDLFKVLENCRIREIEEEAGILNADQLICDYKALIISNFSDVERIHIGVVTFVDISETTINPNEAGTELVGFFTLEELQSVAEGKELDRISSRMVKQGVTNYELEPWSRFIVGTL